MICQTMTEPLTHEARRRLSLTSSLGELVRVAPWVGALATEYDISDERRFAIELCLEEVLSNIVRHGYRGEPGHAFTVDFVRLGEDLVFVVEDNAQPFEPAQPGDAIPGDLNTIIPGGQGLRLLYRFAGSVKYEQLAQGNRLTIRF
jgi:anti-sigma regulatory factor (Ser/Thr protein kinase)